MGAFPPGLSGLGNGQPQQMTQQPNNLAAKGRRNNGSDWTSLDPAIVSSGQITYSRSDSLAHGLRYLEQLTETGNSPARQWPSNHCNLFGLANSTHYNFPSLAGCSNVTVSCRSPTLPPPFLCLFFAFFSDCSSLRYVIFVLFIVLN